MTISQTAATVGAVVMAVGAVLAGVAIWFLTTTVRRSVLSSFLS